MRASIPYAQAHELVRRRSCSKRSRWITQILHVHCSHLSWLTVPVKANHRMDGKCLFSHVIFDHTSIITGCKASILSTWSHLGKKNKGFSTHHDWSPKAKVDHEIIYINNNLYCQKRWWLRLQHNMETTINNFLKLKILVESEAENNLHFDLPSFWVSRNPST